MRFQKHFLVLGLITLMSLAIVMVGCGSDDTPTKISGSMTDPEFVVVQTEVDAFVDSTVAFIKNSVSSMSAVSTFDEYIDPIFYGPVQPDSDYVNTTYADGWHVVHIIRSRTTYGTVLRDSIRFFNDDAVQQRGIDSDSLYYRHQWLYTVGDTTVSYNAYVGSSQFTCTGLNEIISTVNGTNNWLVKRKTVSDNGTTWRDIEINANVNNFSVNKTSNGWISGCPSSGSVSATVHMTYKNGDSAPVISTWTISLTFNNGNMAATVETGDYIWSYSCDVCDVQI